MQLAAEARSEAAITASARTVAELEEPGPWAVARERARGRRSWCVSIVTEAAAQKAARKRPDEEARSRRRQHRRRTLAEEELTLHCRPGLDRNIPPAPSSSGPLS
jgi:hypothetical protein